MNEKDKKYLENHRYYGQVVLFNTQYALCSPYANTTVLRTPDVVMRGMLYSEDNFRGEDYLLNYRLEGSDIGFRAGLSRFYGRDAILTSAMRPMGENTEESIPLPKPGALKMAFGTVLQERRSVRKFSGEPITKGDLSTLLYYTQGITGSLMLGEPEEDMDRIHLRTQPSGGGLFPIRLYAGVRNVKNLEPGIYEYYPHAHALHRCAGFEEADLKASCDYGDIDPAQCAFVLFYGYDLFINARKYGDASLAYALIETGEIAENAQLTACALGLGACDLGGYRKQRIEEMLGMDGLCRHIVHMTILGQIKD